MYVRPNNLITQKVTLLLKDNNIRFAKKNAKQKEVFVSKMIDDYLDLLQRIDKQMAKEDLDPFVKKFGGIISNGKNVDVKFQYSF
ncbi:MAG: DUF6364 family protein [Ginsengibacter sp.]